MAEVSFLHFPEDDHDLLFLEDFDSFSFPSYWPHPNPQNRITPTHTNNNTNRSTTGPTNTPVLPPPTPEERKTQVDFVMDLLHQRVEESDLVGPNEFGPDGVNESTFGVIEENYDLGRACNFDLDCGIEEYHDHINTIISINNNNNSNDTNNAVHVVEEEEDEDDFDFGGFVVSDCGDDFYIARRRENSNGGCNCDGVGGNCESSDRVGGVRVNLIESDSDVDDDDDDDDDDLLGIGLHLEEDFEVDDVNVNVNVEEDGVDDLSSPLFWDSFNLEEEEEGDDHVEVNDFEWEEVDDGVDEREVLSLVADPEEEEGGVISVLNVEEDGSGERGRWEVLLNVRNLDRSPEMENDGSPFGVEGYGDDDIYTAEYEMMFGQFADSENAYLSRPPASKVVVEKLPSVVISEEDVLDDKALCAVCKDQIEVGEEGKQLPCSHRYHGDCIVPWLGIRNTCPVCRYELPTDDADYEQRRLRRAARIA